MPAARLYITPLYNLKNIEGVFRTYAVIKTGGKQYKVQPNDIVDVERLEGEPGKKIVFGEVLAIGDTGKIEVGSPFIKDSSVEAEIVDQHRGEKLTVFKMKRRKSYRRKKGHRQEITKVKINSIKN